MKKTLKSQNRHGLVFFRKRPCICCHVDSFTDAVDDGYREDSLCCRLSRQRRPRFTYNDHDKNLLSCPLLSILC